MTKKIVKPVNPLIYRTAGAMAATLYETGRSQGMTSKYKTPKAYARANLEKFIPIAIKHLIELLKPTSGITDHMRMEIHSALTDPLNDPDLMEKKVDTDLNAELLALSIRKSEKNNIKTEIKTVLHR